MSAIFLVPEGKPIEIEQLNVSKVLSLALALAQEKIEFATLIQCLTHQDGETVIFDVEVEVPQLPVYNVKNRERVATIFYKKDDRIPEVLALRPDFPRVPHLNLRDKEFPRSLCLYDEVYRNLKSSWTAQRFVERIRQWLALTAKGELHQNDQPLEPLISGYVGRIVLPDNYLIDKSLSCPEKLYLSGRGNLSDMLFLVAEREKPSDSRPLACIASMHLCNPQQHGLIYQKPHTLRDVALFAEKGGLDLLSALRNRLKDWWKENSNEYNFFENPLILILVCPKTREEDAKTESIDVWAFISGDSFKEVGKKIGLWEERYSHIVPLIPTDYTANGNDIKVDLLNTSFQLTKKSAAYLNGLEDIIDINIVAVGVGALGSQVIMNLARSGTGTWKLIDDDILMPHNVTRHALSSSAVGFKKSDVIALVANDFIHGDKLFSAIPADVIEPNKYQEEVRLALENADAILDMSASITVARHLAADNSSSAKRISLFLNPTGNDLVLLAEDKKRATKLDEIEMQLYRAIIEQDDLKEHFKILGERKRYGRSCRDITTVLPQDIVAMHAAIGSHELQQVFHDESPHITVWKSDLHGNVKRIDVVVNATIRYQIGEWTVVIDIHTIDKVHHIRDEKLPNETGGVLIGSFDLERKIIYIADVVPSPPDSEEWPTLYIRGSKGLKDRIEDISQKTFGMLGYIGEWHTHPDGISTAPSNDDLKVFAWLTEWMDRDGLPATMMIIGNNNRSSCFVGEIKQVENLIPDTQTK
jgi:hypothetical protein